LKILVLGASGLLGSAVMRVLSADGNHDTVGSVRSSGARVGFEEALSSRLLEGVDADDPDGLIRVLLKVRPDVVVNCIGVIKKFAVDPLVTIPINAILPHRLAQLCDLVGARLVHISTDCVFSGKQGLYKESDPADAEDLYGRSKLLGELDRPGAITLRTSIIGEELRSANGLVSWFLSQRGVVNGYTRAIFSGLPTFELGRVIRDYVLPHPELTGVYQVAADPISKFDLLGLVNETYGKGLVIQPNCELSIDRSLDGGRFAAATGYRAEPWPQLIQNMHDFHAGKR
jgi:dTDP-4-dehydrorhamnose reductase